jgi:AhpD family alkylhydroperoxidase
VTGAPRLDAQKIDPASYKAVLALEGYVRGGTLDPGLLNLIKIRASQLNGCAFCLDMHNREAAEEGESPRRLYVLAGWREAPDLFTAAERAALALTEVVTLISQAGVPDDVWSKASDNFTDPELVQLLMAISTINVWNRLAVATHQQLPELEANG